MPSRRTTAGDIERGYDSPIQAVDQLIPYAQLHLYEGEFTQAYEIISKARKLAESDKVHAVAGIFLANEGYALAPKVDEYQMPTVWAVVSADDLTQRKPG